MSLTVEGHAIDTRVVTMPRVDGEGIVMRILDKSQALIGLDSLGMSRDVRGAVRGRVPARLRGRARHRPDRLRQVDDALRARSTRSTSPSATSSRSRTRSSTSSPGINQLQVNLKAGLTFASGLRAMLRADPDVIMVGEIRDGETAKIAVESALTGHLVLSTLHTNDAPSAITRLTEMGIEPFLSASAIVAVVAQRLVRQLCTYCKRRTMLSVSSLKKAGFDVAFDLEAYEPVGCGRCSGSGYKGRTGLYEVMVHLRRDPRPHRRAGLGRRHPQDRRRSQGMRTLRVDGFEKVKNGITSIAEVARVT